MTNEIESAIERISDFLADLKLVDSVYAPNEHRPKLYKDFQTLLSVAQLFLEAEKGMPEKKEIISCPHGEMSACDDCIDQNKRAMGFNSAIDLCTAHLVKKCEGIEEIVKVARRKWYATLPYQERDMNNQNINIAQAIKDYLVKGE